MVMAWHFVGPRLRDGSLVPPDGKTLVHKGPLVVCKTGFHASERLIDALRYAPGCTICRVAMDEDIIKMDDQLVARKRTVLWRVDGEALLRKFARNCALGCVDKWKPPMVVLQYLETGDPTLQQVAWSAAWSASESATMSVQNKNLTKMVNDARRCKS